MTHDSTASADRAVDQTETFNLLHLIGFYVDGPLPADTVTVLAAHTKALAQATALDTGIFSSHVITEALVDVLGTIKDRKIGLAVANTLQHPQLVQIASPVLAAKVETDFGSEIAGGLRTHVLVEIVSKHFDLSVDRAIQKIIKQHLLDSLRKQLTEALTQTEHARFAPFIRRFLASLSEVEKLVSDDDSDAFSVVFAIFEAFHLAIAEEVRSRMGFGDVHGHGHHGFTGDFASGEPHVGFVVLRPEDLGDEDGPLGFPHSAFSGGFPTSGVVFDRSDRSGRTSRPGGDVW